MQELYDYYNITEVNVIRIARKVKYFEVKSILILKEKRDF